jgi:hypothetical protein
LHITLSKLRCIIVYIYKIMGNDGQNVLEVRGKPEDLVEIHNFIVYVSKQANDPDVTYPTCKILFADAVCKFRKPNHLIVIYEFRNEPCYDFLRELLHNYPKCWMKNTFDSEEGLCGVWIAQIKNGEMETQSHTWTELCIEECEFYGLP